MVTEIHDAVRTLTALVPETAQHRIDDEVHSAGLRGARATAAAEHIRLQVAIRAHRAGQTVPEAHPEPRLHADNSASAARVIAQQLRLVHRNRVQQVIQHLMSQENHVLNPPHPPTTQESHP
jgi:hypothetical protein